MMFIKFQDLSRSTVYPFYSTPSTLSTTHVNKSISTAVIDTKQSPQFLIYPYH